MVTNDTLRKITRGEKIRKGGVSLKKAEEIGKKLNKNITFVRGMPKLA